MAPSNVSLSAFLLGVASHQFYFKPFEHHLSGVRYIQAAIAIAILTPFSLSTQRGSYNIEYDVCTSRWAPFALFFVGLYTCLLGYRAFFHPLNKFPGPFAARLTDLWWPVQIAKKADATLKLLKLHEQYGPILRIGSSSISINHPDAVQAIYGIGSKCSKGPWYEQDKPFLSMHTTRSRVIHDKRRRVWSSAFSDRSLRGYESRLRPYLSSLVTQLAAFGNQPVNVSAWFNFFSYDVMGDVAFNESFGMLEKGEEHWAIALLNTAMDAHAFQFPEWLFRIILAAPGVSKDYWRFIGYCSDALSKRMAQTPHVPDIMTALLAPFEKTGPPVGPERALLEADSRLIIVAGSDTTAATLTHLFCYLCRKPEYITKLREEIKGFVTADGDAENADLQTCDLLNGCINEALRLSPPVPTQIQRVTPPEGIAIGRTYIPGNMKVWSPQYVISRNPAIYEDPDSFIPERWYSRSELLLDGGKSFAPFNLGLMGCIGKPLALMEVRAAVAKVLTSFDVEFAPGEDGKMLLEETRNHFTLGLAPLRLVFRTRKSDRVS